MLGPKSQVVWAPALLILLTIGLGSAASVAVSSELDFELTALDVQLDMTDAPTKKTYSGWSTISFHTNESLTTYRVISVDSEVRVQYPVLKQQALPISIVRYWQSDKKFNVEFQVQGGPMDYSLALKFESDVVGEGELGVYMTNNKAVIGTSLYPNAAKKAFPCLEDISYKVPSFLKVNKLPAGYSPINAMPKSVPLPSYGLGFILTKGYTYQTVGRNKFTVMFPSGMKLSQYFTNALDTDFYNTIAKLTNQPTVVLVPGVRDFSSQCYGLIALRPDFMVDDRTPTVEQQKGMTMATLNALGKYYFRVVLTPSSWNEYWISDSLPLYLQYILFDLSPDSKIENQDSLLYTTEVVRVAMSGGGPAAIPASIDPSKLDTKEIYGSVYKGASTLFTFQTGKGVTIENILGAISTFVNANQWKSVSSNDLMTGLASAYKDLPDKNQLAQLTREWLSKDGYPELSVQVGGGSFTVNKYPSKTWPAPFTYQSLEGPGCSGSIWLLEDVRTVPCNIDSTKTIDVNNFANGMFRVSYGDNNWKNLFHNLLIDVDFAAKLDDLFTFSWDLQPKININAFLNAFDQLGALNGYSTWTIAMKHFTTIYNAYFEQPGFKDRFLEVLAISMYQTYSSQNDWSMPATKTTLADRMMTRMILQMACRYNVSSCVGDSISNKNSPTLNRDLQYIIDCTSLLDVDVNTWTDKFNTLYNTGDSQYSRADALYSLACPINKFGNESEVIGTYLNKILNKEVLEQDAARAFESIYSHPEYVNQTLDFLLYHYINISEAYGDKFFADVLMDMAPMLSTEYHKSLLEEFIANNDFEDQIIRVALKKSMAQLKRTMSIAWKNMDAVANWLNVPTSPTVTPPVPPTPSPTGSPPAPSPTPTGKSSASQTNGLPFSNLLGTFLLATSALLMRKF